MSWRGTHGAYPRVMHMGLIALFAVSVVGCGGAADHTVGDSSRVAASDGGSTVDATPVVDMTSIVTPDGAASDGAVAPRSGKLKFNPGFYAVFDTAGGVTIDDLNPPTGGFLTLINSTATTVTRGNPPDNLTGFMFWVNWRNIDKGTTAPDYDWTTIDAYAAAAKAKGKQWWLGIWPMNYGPAPKSGTLASGSICVPEWMVKSSTGSYGDGNPANVMGNFGPELGSGVFPKFYKPAVMNGFIAMMQAIAERYDSDPYFEGVTNAIGSSYPMVSGDASTDDYNPDDMLTQHVALMAGARAAFKTTNFQISLDYMFEHTDTRWNTLLDAAVKYQITVGGCDSWTQSWIYPQLPYSATGQNPLGTVTNPFNGKTREGFYRGVYADQYIRGWLGKTDYRGKVMIAGTQEMTEMGGYIGTFTPEDVWQTRGPKLDNVQYMFYDINFNWTGNVGNSTTQWKTGTYPFIQGAGKTNQVSPY